MSLSLRQCLTCLFVCPLHSTCSSGEVEGHALVSARPERPERHQPELTAYANSSGWSQPMLVHLFTINYKIYSSINTQKWQEIIIDLLLLVYLLTGSMYWCWFVCLFICMCVCCHRVDILLWCLPQRVSGTWASTWSDLSMCQLFRRHDCRHPQVSWCYCNCTVLFFLLPASVFALLCCYITLCLQRQLDPTGTLVCL